MIRRDDVETARLWIARAASVHRRQRAAYWRSRPATPFERWLAGHSGPQDAQDGTPCTIGGKLDSEYRSDAKCAYTPSCAVLGQAADFVPKRRVRNRALERREMARAASKARLPRFQELLAIAGDGCAIRMLRVPIQRAQGHSNGLLIRSADGGSEHEISAALWRMWIRERWIDGPHADTSGEPGELWHVIPPGGAE